MHTLHLVGLEQLGPLSLHARYELFFSFVSSCHHDDHHSVYFANCAGFEEEENPHSGQHQMGASVVSAHVPQSDGEIDTRADLAVEVCLDTPRSGPQEVRAGTVLADVVCLCAPHFAREGMRLGAVMEGVY